MLHYFPLTLPFLLILFFLFLFLVIMVEVGILGYAYQTIGINQRYIFLLLLMCFWGSYINIPIYQLPPEIIRSGGQVTFFGIPYVIPTLTRWPGTLIAVNVGGAVIPTMLSIYLIYKNQLFSLALIGEWLWCQLSFIGWLIRFLEWVSPYLFWSLLWQPHW